MTLPASVTLPRSMATQLRRAVAGIAADSTTLAAACGRRDQLVVVPTSVADAQLPVTVVAVQGDTRIGGIGDRRRATLALACLAQGDDGPDRAEGMAALWRSLLTEAALTSYGLEYPLILPSDVDGDAFEFADLPQQMGRAQLALQIDATLVPA